MTESKEQLEMRKALTALVNTGYYSEDEAKRRQELENEHGIDNVWDDKELQNNFVVLGFMAPFTHVRRRSDNKEGLVMFTHQPRFYFKFEETR